ncbi:MAG TPA: Dabb family protein [Chloroflexota bacterium]|nr:Dabb family protein [Chloroflexota bacterium]
MIVHIVLFKARSNLSAYDEALLGEAIGSLAGISSVESMTWGPDFSGRAQGFTHAAILHFADRESLQRYLDDDVHKKAVESFNQLAPERLILDYEAAPELT